VEDLRLKLEQIMNESEKLEFGNPEMELLQEMDLLNNTINKNCFGPVNEWRCLFAMKKSIC
jgi:hypothetical protein